jgi:hypothetical protein
MKSMNPLSRLVKRTVCFFLGHQEKEMLAGGMKQQVCDRCQDLKMCTLPSLWFAFLRLIDL